MMEWLKQIIESNLKEDGTVDVEAVMNATEEEAPKHVFPKAKYNELSEKYKEANATLDTLKKQNKDNEELQAELTSYKQKVSDLEKEAADNAIKQTIKEALVKAKATDVEYLMFKLGDVEVDGDGNVKDLDNKIKDLQSSQSRFFEQPESNDQGWKSINGAKLPTGDSSTGLTRDEIAKMSPEQINDNWEAIKSSLENGGTD